MPHIQINFRDSHDRDFKIGVHKNFGLYGYFGVRSDFYGPIYGSVRVFGSPFDGLDHIGLPKSEPNRAVTRPTYAYPARPKKTMCNPKSYKDSEFDVKIRRSSLETRVRPDPTKPNRNSELTMNCTGNPNVDSDRSRTLS